MKLIFEKSEQFILTHGRELEKALFNYHFKDGSKNSVLNELIKFQNQDGGFGNGIEPDLRLPQSTDISTWCALRLLKDLEISDDETVLNAALDYLELKFNTKKRGWDIVVPEVNNCPHAPWWNYEGAIKHFGWGNPSAEILGFFIKYRSSSKLIKPLLELAPQKILEVKPGDFHEIDCFKKLYDLADGNLKEQLRKPLISLMQNSIEKDPEKQSEYVARPLTFIDSPSDKLISAFSPTLIEENLCFIVKSFDHKSGCWHPNWDWAGNYPEQWQKAKQEWQGILTLNNLLKLRAFGKI